MKPNRIFLGVLLLAIVSLLVFLLSSTFSYFKVGADVKDIFHVDQAYNESHKPYIEWLPDDPQIYGAINPYIRKDISEAYTGAWKVLNLSLSSGKDINLSAHFMKDQLSKIKDRLSSMDKSSIEVEQVDLSHHLTLHFLSLDKTVVSFSDNRVWIRKLIDKTYIDEDQDFIVTMCLVDGRWLINGMQRTKTEIKRDIALTQASLATGFKSMQGINYYPKDFPWMDFWTNYDHEIITKDFARMKNMNFKLVRFFIPFEIFGAGNVHPDFLEHMDHFVETAVKNNISLMPCLFDFPVGYGLEKYTRYDRQLETIMTRYHKETIIIAWDLKNELDRDFELQGKEESLRWLDFIITRARSYTDQALTVGWSKAAYASLRSESLDWVSFHFYEDIDLLGAQIDAVQKDCKKPVVISEFGMSTYNGIWGGGGSVTAQKALYKKMQTTCKQKSVAHIAWCLYDYREAPSAVFGKKPWVKAKQKYFGILDQNGNIKW